MTRWQITNQTSGHDLGVYEGDTAEEALDAMARDAGYDSHAHTDAEIGCADLVCTEVTARAQAAAAEFLRNAGTFCAPERPSDDDDGDFASWD